LRFVNGFSEYTDEEQRPHIFPFANLQKSVVHTKADICSKVTSPFKKDTLQRRLDEMLSTLVNDKTQTAGEKTSSLKKRRRPLQMDEPMEAQENVVEMVNGEHSETDKDMKIAQLQKKIKHLEKINQEMYKFAASVAMENTK
jgi:hypothetical protein